MNKNIRPPIIFHTCGKAGHISRFCRSKTQKQEDPKKSLFEEEGEVKFVQEKEDSRKIWVEVKKDNTEKKLVDASTVDTSSTSS